jgi:RHS repeat-associated protein
LAALGITDEERTTLATLYTAGTSLWRNPFPHFTRADINRPATGDSGGGGGGPIFSGPHGGSPDDSDSGGGGGGGGDPSDDDCQETGSIIDCQTQVLGERVSLTGTPYDLRYMSARVPGYQSNVLNVMVSGPSHQSQLLKIDLDVNIAGQRFQQTFPPLNNQSTSIVWDGKDAFGRPLSGRQPATFAVKYTYPAAYLAPPDIVKAFARNPPAGVQIDGDTGRGTITLERQMFAQLSHPDARATEGLGGWSLDVHHTYDPKSMQLTLGNGFSRGVPPVGLSPEQGLPIQVFSFDPTPDGSLYVGYNIPFALFHDLSRKNPDGTFQDLLPGSAPIIIRAQGPNVLHLEAGSSFGFPNVIRRFAPDGTDTDVAGKASCIPSLITGDEGPATQACLGAFIDDFKVSPTGELYILSEGVSDEPPLGMRYGSRLSRVDCSGVIHNMNPNQGTFTLGFAIAPDGALYVAEQGTAAGTTIHRLEPDGTLSAPLAGQTTGTAVCADDDGSNGVRDHICGGGLMRMEVGPDGKIYILMPIQLIGSQSTTRGAINVVRPDGKVAEVFPGLSMSVQFDFRIAHNGDFWATAKAPVVGPATFGVFHLKPSLPPVSDAGYSVASRDGSEIYVFDGQGRQVTTLDALTSTSKYAFVYDSHGFVSSVTDQNGLVTSLLRDAAGNPTAIVSPTGQTTTLGTDADGYLASVVSPGGAAYQFQYSNGLLTLETDPRNGVHQFTYDGEGRLIQDQNPSGGGWTIFGPPGSGTSSMASRTSSMASQAVSAVSGTVTMVSGEGRTQSNSTGAALGGDATSGPALVGSKDRTITGSDGLQTTIHYDSQSGRQVTAPDGTVIRTKMAPDPRLGMTAPYLAQGTATTPGGLTHSISMSRTATAGGPFGLILASQTDTTVMDGQTMTRTYDGASRASTVVSAAGRQVVFTRDDHGRPLSLQVGTLAPTSFGYDDRGRLISLTQGSGATTRVTSFAYDELDRPISSTDALSRTISYGYDQDNRVVSGTMPDGAQTLTSYDSAGDMLSLTPPGETSHQFTYTPAGDKVSYSPPALPDVTAPTTSYAHNLDRQLTLITRPDGKTVSFDYDFAGRLATTTYDAGSVARTYSPVSGLLDNVVATDGGIVTLTRDGPLTLSSAWSGTVTGTVSRTYNSSFLVASESVNGGGPVSFTYDADLFLTGAGALTMARDPATGAITGATVGNVTDVRTYNGFGEPTGYLASYAGTALLETHDTRDSVGRVSARDQTVGATSHSYSYAYDPAGRLLSVTTDATTTATYTYDQNGNRLSRTAPGQLEVATLDAQDRLLAYGKFSYTYNANGELATKTDTTTGQTTSFGYDALGNLRHVALPDGRQIDYVIDGFNRRIGKKINGTLVRGWLYRNGLTPVAELDGAGAVRAQFVFGDNKGSPAYMISGGTNYVFVTDDLGTPRLIVNADTGAIADQIDVDEFGRTVSESSPGFQPFGFVGGIYDSDTGLIRFGARDYDPFAGRWTTKDPILFRGGQSNLYVYAHNDPINGRDLKGLCHPNREIDPGIIVNGCGQQGGLYCPPDSPRGFNFGPACENHDFGYQMCGTPKSDIDQQFLKDMLAACEGVPYSDTCQLLADAYAGAVQLFGQDAYDAGQATGCRQYPDRQCPMNAQTPFDPGYHDRVCRGDRCDPDW